MLRKGLLLTVLVPLIVSGSSTIVLHGPDDTNGYPCTVGSPHCILGDPLMYLLFDVRLTRPDDPNANWVLSIDTDYGVPIPGSPDVIPTFNYADVPFSMSDFLIEWSGNDYGIVLHPHDGYAAGDLYRAAGFQTSKDVMGPYTPDVPRPNLPVLLDPGGFLLGQGVLIGVRNPGADGITNALYTVTVQFSAPAGFLSTGKFTVYASSYVCANGYLTGDGSFPNTPGAPEPNSLLLFGIALAFFLVLYFLGFPTQRKR